jgi:FMN phosphatase YigB (HAD superfamily)
MKKIIFFDATGTLWYPKRTKNMEDPGWPHRNNSTYAGVLPHMTLTPHAKETLLKLKRMKIRLVVVSAVPKPNGSGDIENAMAYFGLDNIFDEIHAVGMNVKGGAKGPEIVSILKRLRIPKKYALMVGDAYWADYRLVRDRGVDAVLFYSEWQRSIRPNAWRVKKTIKDLNGIFKYVY